MNFKFIFNLVFLFFIYSLVLQISFFSINTKDILFIILLSGNLFLLKEIYETIYIKELFFIFISYLSILSFLIIVSFMKGNELMNILFFVKPFSLLFIVPVVSLLIKEFGIIFYIRHFIYAIILLITYFYLLHFISTVSDSHSLMKFLDSVDDNLSYAVYGDFYRVFFRTFIFVIPFIIYYLLFNKFNFKNNLIILISISSIFLSLTFGLILSTYIVILMFLIYKRKYLMFISLILLIICIFFSYFVFDFSDLFSSNKLRSFNIKYEQVVSSIPIILDNLYFGKGMGSIFSNFDSRLQNSLILEVFPAMLLTIGGIIGAILIVYLYFPYTFYNFENDKISVFLFLSQMSVFIASIANPYIWSGGIGLFFVLFSLSYHLSKKGEKFEN